MVVFVWVYDVVLHWWFVLFVTTFQWSIHVACVIGSAFPLSFEPLGASRPACTALCPSPLVGQRRSVSLTTIAVQRGTVRGEFVSRVLYGVIEHLCTRNDFPTCCILM
jgi:hypothetical protein